MIPRAFFLILLSVIITGLVINSEREYRELQAVQARQIYQKQILLEEQSQLRLELQRMTGAVR